MKQLTSLIDTVRNFFEAFPRVPQKALKPLVPFLAWFMLLQGIIQIISGLRGISWGLRYGSLPRMFATLIDVNPVFFLVGGILMVTAGALYLMAYPKFSQTNTRHEGWEKWVLAAGVLSITRLYETLFISGSITVFLVGLIIGWYLIFEFERVIGLKKSARNKKSSKKTNK